MPPKKKPPSQAGKFKPLKRPVKRPTAAPAAAAAASAPPSSAGGERGRPSHDGHASGRGGGVGGHHRGRGPGGGRGGRVGGRGGRGRGRGGRGGRGGRFIVPTGAAFFTAESAKRDDASGGGAGGVPSQAREVVKVGAGMEGAVFMPGSSGMSSSAGGGRGVARSAAESMAAAARAREGEGEEIIVAEMMDLDAEDDDGGVKKKSVLDGPSRSDMPSLFDDERQNEEPAAEQHGVSDAFLYDSDSSAEERRARRRSAQGGGEADFRMAPTQLPFPVGRLQGSMYDCQDDKDDVAEEKKSSDFDATAVTTTASAAKLSDPPLRSPFLDLESVSEELKQLDTNSWFVMKFPTRLPHLDTSSSSANASRKVAALIKSELNEESQGVLPEYVGSSSKAADIATGAAGSAAPSASAASVSSGPALGYDDTLKDSASGRYGRIEVRRSGRTELVVGGGDGGRPEVRLLVHEGLQCGFRQEAACIDPDEGTFVMLGDAGKSLIVTPDVERAFLFS